MAYCDSADVLRYCSPSETADIEGAIGYATDAVNTFTNDIHEPLEGAELTITVGRSGVAYIGKTCRGVSSVAEAATGDEMDAGIWAFQAGKHPAIRLTGNAAPNLLRVGFEPWVRIRPWDGTRLNITAQLGPATTPAAVREATAILAARWLCVTGQAAEGMALTAHGQREQGVSSISVEGYAVSYAEPSAESTGTPSVDRLLTPYRRAVSRWS